MKKLIFISMTLISMNIQAEIDNSISLDERLVDKAKELVDANNELVQVKDVLKLKEVNCNRRKVMREYVELVNELEKSNLDELKNIEAIENDAKNETDFNEEKSFNLAVMKQHQYFRESFNSMKHTILEEIEQEDKRIQEKMAKIEESVIKAKETTLDSICNTKTE